MSSRSDTCIGCLQQGQFVATGATVSWMRGKWAGSAPRLIRRFRSTLAACVFSSIVAALAIICSISSSASSTSAAEPDHGAALHRQ
jgi:hypothetical protein